MLNANKFNTLEPKYALCAGQARELQSPRVADAVAPVAGNAPRHIKITAYVESRL